MIRFFSMLSLFLLILLSIKWALLHLTAPLNPSAGSLPGKMHLLNTLGASANALFIGSSRTNTSLDPVYFDSLTQHTHAVNLGVNSLFMPYTANLCAQLLERPPPGLRYILFELSLPTKPLDPFKGKLLTAARFYWNYESAVLAKGTVDADSLINVRLNDQFYYTLSLSELLNLGRLSALKDMLRSAARQAMSPKNSKQLPDTEDLQKGYIRIPGQLTVKSARLSATHTLGLKTYRDTSLRMDPAYAFYYERLNAIQRLSAEKGIRLFFYLPNRMTVEEAEVLPPFFRQLAPGQRLAIPYDARFDQLFEPRFSAEEAHLNHRGARVYTGLIAEAFGRQVHPAR